MSSHVKNGRTFGLRIINYMKLVNTALKQLKLGAKNLARFSGDQ